MRSINDYPDTEEGDRQALRDIAEKRGIVLVTLELLTEYIEPREEDEHAR